MMKKRNRSISLLIALIFTLPMVLAGCSSSGSGDSGSEAPSTDAGSSGDAGSGYDWGGETYELIFANADTATSGPSVGVEEAIKYISEQSDGHIVIKPYYNTLVESADLLDSACEGVADIVCVTTTLYPGTMQALDILSQKFTGEMPDIAGINDICRICIDTMPVFQEEAAAMGVRLADVTVTPSIIFGCHDDDANNINVPSDLKGLVVGATSNFALSLEHYGASTIALAPADWYTSFERGLLDVHSISWAICSDFGLSDVMGSYVTFGNNGGLGVTPLATLVNLDTWNSLPDFAQEIIVDGFRIGGDYTQERNVETEQRVYEEESGAGKVIHHIPEEEMGPWYEMAEVGMDLWKEAAEAAGYDADQIRADYDKIVADYLAANP